MIGIIRESDFNHPLFTQVMHRFQRFIDQNTQRIHETGNSNSDRKVNLFVVTETANSKCLLIF